MKRIKTILALSAFSLIVLALPSVASAQWGGRNDNYGNGRYNNRNIQSTARTLKSRAKAFERVTDRYDDRRGGNQAERIENLADDFSKAADKFEKAYGNGRNLGNSEDEARRLLDLGSRIDQALYNRRADRGLESQWSLIRNDLNVIGQVYGLNYNRGNRNNRNNRNRRNIPFPLPF